MHWMRVPTAPSIDCETARASTVFAVPGTSSKSTWPLQASAVRTSRISSRLPWTTVSMFASSRSATSTASRRSSASAARAVTPTSVVRPSSAATSLGRIRVGCGKRRLDRGSSRPGRQDLELARPEPLAADLAHHGVAQPRVRSAARRERLLRGAGLLGAASQATTPPSATASSAAADATFATTRVGRRRRGHGDRHGPGQRLQRRRPELVREPARCSARTHGTRRTARCATRPIRRSSSDSGASSCRESSARVRSQDGP